MQGGGSGTAIGFYKKNRALLRPGEFNREVSGRGREGEALTSLSIDLN